MAAPRNAGWQCALLSQHQYSTNQIRPVTSSREPPPADHFHISQPIGRGDLRTGTLLPPPHLHRDPAPGGTPTRPTHRWQGVLGTCLDRGVSYQLPYRVSWGGRRFRPQLEVVVLRSSTATRLQIAPPRSHWSPIAMSIWKRSLSSCNIGETCVSTSH